MALGRGLSELLGEVEAAYENGTDSNKNTSEIDINLIEVNPYQPRKIFNEEKLIELANSIKSHGLMQPIVVIKKDDNYILVAGERRLRAAKLIELDSIKAVILDIEESKLREYALLENIQRDDLNILEVAYSYAGLINEYNMTHEELSNIVHKSRSSITNVLRLLTLSVYTQQMISADKISLGHAKLIIGLSEDDQKTIVDSIIGQKLSVRETESIVKKLKNGEKTSKKVDKKTSSYDFKPLTSLLENFQNENIKAKLSSNKLTIDFRSQDDVETFLKYFSAK